MATASLNSATGASSDVFVAAAAGVAALDTPQLNQTKLEIRNLVSEIAQLAASDIELQPFLQGALPRITSAMAASAAALWCIRAQDDVCLAGHHELPFPLRGDTTSGIDLVTATDTASTSDGPSPDLSAHNRILVCVAQDGSPVLVPPKSTRLAAERPANPLDQSLLIVPIKIFERCEYLLEVIQPHSGGPAAQRGYLRFVAQMADLVAEHLRRSRLRELTQDSVYVQSLCQALTQTGSAASPIDRARVIARSWANLLQADLAMTLTPRDSWVSGYRSHRWSVTAISDVDHFDTRSQAIQAAESWLSSADSSPQPEFWSTETTVKSLQQSCATELCRQLSCQQVLRVPLAGLADQFQVVLAFTGTIDRDQLARRAQELAQAFAPLVQTRALAHTSARLTSRSRWQRAERWVVRFSTVLLLASIALFPVPDSLTATAVLEAEDKQFYYAPSMATIERVLVDNHQPVKQGDVLVELVDKQLQARLEELQGQLLSTGMQLEQDRAALLRGEQSGRAHEDELGARIQQARLNINSINQQLDILRQQAEQLHIRARSDAIVTTWDARNRLQGRPVTAGQLLLTSCAPNSDWQLKLSIPERQAGQIQEALNRSPGGLNVQFSLSSHPGEVRTGKLIELSKQLIKDRDGNSSLTGTVLIRADQLPTKTDGAVARASIDCGRTFVFWLVVRDAYRQAITWWRLL